MDLMPVQIGQKKESDFGDPLGLLSDCHRRIERFLAVLIKISQKRNGGTIPPEERTSLETALTYFRNSAPKHTADEEDSLFPRMRSSEEAAAARECLARLEGDHVTASQDHQIVDSLGRVWLDQGALTSEQAGELNSALERLGVLYARHIAIEDNELFPLAGRMLDATQLSQVGQEMAQRRGVTTPEGSKTAR
jgi:hemerythrin-like domain-containing protein